MEHIFESFNFKMSLWTLGGLTVFFLQHLGALLKVKRFFVVYAFSALAIACWYMYGLFDRVIPITYLAALSSFFTAIFVFSALWIGTSNYFLKKYKVEYSTCIRDSLMLLLGAELASIYFLRFNEFLFLAAFISTGVTIFFIYDRRIISHKLPDLRAVLDIPHDDPGKFDGILDINACQLKKTQLGNELRNSILLQRGQPLRFRITNEGPIRLGVGCKDFSLTPSFLKIEAFYPNGSSAEIFSKFFNPRTNFRDRSWNDLLLDIATNKSGQTADHILLSNCSQKDTNIYLNLPSTRSITRSKTKNNIYILIVDGLRFEYLDPPETLREKGYHIVADFLEGSMVYSEAYSQGVWTLPTFASFLSSLYMSAHDLYHPNPKDPKMRKAISKDLILFPEILRDSGYRTYAYAAGQRTNPNYGYSKGFDSYMYKLCEKEIRSGTADAIIEWVKDKTEVSVSGEKAFYYLHFLEAHTPFYPPRNLEWRYDRISKKDIVRDLKGYRKLGKRVELDNQQCELFVNLYRAEIDYAISRIDQFLLYLLHKRLYDDAIILLAGDHGLGFGEHNVINSFDIYRESTHVGFAVKYPKALNKRGTSSDLVSATIDVMPTILDVIGADHNLDISGRSLLRPPEGGISKKTVISEDLYDNKYTVALRDHDFSFVYKTHFNAYSFKDFETMNEIFELYDLKEDPYEQRNIIKKADPSITEEFLALLNNHIKNQLRYHGVDKDINIYPKDI